MSCGLLKSKTKQKKQKDKTQTLFISYINGKVDSQLVMTSSDATSNIVSSFSSNVCSAKVIALFNQPEVYKGKKEGKKKER